MLINPILANIGLPMVAVYLPFAWFALVPIIFIEAGYGARRYHLSFRRALLAQAIANSFSTVIGIPMTWFAIVLVSSCNSPGRHWAGMVITRSNLVEYCGCRCCVDSSVLFHVGRDRRLCSGAFLPRSAAANNSTLDNTVQRDYLRASASLAFCGTSRT